ncbi:MAG: class I SAM-dependent methyltransferase [Myxococcales bacterium]|nr:class I SAM-dependent methyltransferase [Myxococcales bacterium]
MSPPSPTCPCGAYDARPCGDTGALYATRYLLMKCRACGLRFSDPTPAPDEARAYYASAYGGYASDEQLARDYTQGELRAARLLAKLRRHAGPTSGRLVDVGCGNGAVVHHLAARSSFDCSGVEVTASSVAAARTRTSVAIFHGTLDEAAFPTGHFAVARLDQVIEHVAAFPALLAELHRVLAPGGLLFVGTPNFAGLSARLLGARWKEVLPYDHVAMFSPASLRAHLARAGFDVRSIVTGGVELVRRPDLTDLAPWAHRGLVGRVAGLGLRVLGLGDVVTALARR